MDKFDFSGWATKANLKCTDGRTIMKDAFKHNDGKTVPLVWNHQHNDPAEVLGKAILENREEGVYAYCIFNDTEQGKTAKLLVEHGDVNSLSIYANQLKQSMSNVLHGDIKEVSLVLAGANPGAFIDSIIVHGEESEEEAIIFTGEELSLSHAEEPKTAEAKKEPEKMPESKEKTVKDVLDEMTEEQRTVVYALIGQALEDTKSGEKEEAKEIDIKQSDINEEGTDTMKHNVFDNEEKKENILSHADTEAIFADLKRYGSLKDSVIAHCGTDSELYHSITDDSGNSVTYGVANMDYLFPDARNLNVPPEFISRKMDWVRKVINGTSHTPFSRIKSMFADITPEDARAKGYIKGNQKTEEVFSLLKRTTTPTTIYKKQKLDRDDVVDITDFDVVAWIKAEMRVMLDEEIARALLVGDGRSGASDDKINEQNIRPIWTDADLYTIKSSVSLAAAATSDEKAREFIKTVIRSRKNYKGSGSPTLYTTEDMVTDCLLLEDGVGRPLYDSVTKLAQVLRVSEIVTIPVMENLTRSVSGVNHSLMGIIVNLKDYNVGADKGGAINLFDDFDIDYNQQKYLIETRCSGALTKPYSAIALEFVPTAG